MFYSVSCNTAKINGANGVYDGVVADKSVRYGRNAIHNFGLYQDKLKAPLNPPNLKNLNEVDADTFHKKMNDFGRFIDELPPLNYEVKYMPTIKLDKKALFAAAYEEMGQRESVDVDELTSKIQRKADLSSGKGGFEMSARALDLNRDKKITVDEYATSILLKDALSRGDKFAKKNVRGSFTNQGAGVLSFYQISSNYRMANSTFQKIYDVYKLGSDE